VRFRATSDDQIYSDHRGFATATLVFRFDKAQDALSWIKKTLSTLSLLIFRCQLWMVFIFEKLQNKTISIINQPIIAVTGRNDIDLEHYQNSGQLLSGTYKKLFWQPSKLF
jgi:hypothetical protein